MKHNRWRKTGRARRDPSLLERINPDVAGIDLHSSERFVAAPADLDPTPVQSFGTFTSDLLRLADGARANEIATPGRGASLYATTTVRTSPVRDKRPVAGYILTALVALFLVFDTVMKVLEAAPAVEGTVQLGYGAGTVFWIGIIELVCLVLYLLPRTSVLGALLLTGYLGGAIATHVIAGSPWATHTLFPIYVALMLWGLYLRDPRLRALVIT